MNRFLFVTLVVATASSLAQAPVVRQVEPQVIRIDPAPVPSELMNPAAVPAVEAGPAPFDVGFHLADKPSAGGREFHPMCDCGCSIERLDQWCDCCVPCCTTDEWCDHCCHDALGTSRLLADGCWVSDDQFCDVLGGPCSCYDGAFRFGWWGTHSTGSPTRIGEFQSLRSSPFWDLDTILSDGTRTLDIALTGLDNEANSARARYYGPSMSAKLRYDRFFRRWDHDPMAAPNVSSALPNPPNPGPNQNPANSAYANPGFNVVSDDLNVGQDYAIRVQMLDAKFKGGLTENVDWKLNVWSMRRFGERQANATGHCYDLNPAAPVGGSANQNIRCHVLSQRQTVDWTTVEVQPAVEARFECLTVEYSHTIRTFSSDDQLVTRNYTNFGYTTLSGTPGPQYAYALVPDSVMQIDRIKAVADLDDCTQLYSNMYLGYMENQFRDTKRQLAGLDVRLTNRSIDGLTITPYASVYEENNQLPPTNLTTVPYGVTQAAAGGGGRRGEPGSLEHPIDYNRSRYGVKGNWRPYHDCGSYDECDLWSGLALNGGYEYYRLSRDHALWLAFQNTGAVEFSFQQPDTISHTFEFGPTMKWTRDLNTYARYRASFIEDPLIGFKEFNDRVNTSLPTQTHRVDVGGTWAPAPNFMANAQFSILNSWHDSEYAQFSEDNYPFFLTLWYAPSEKLSLTGGYGYFSNWIDQNIGVGFGDTAGYNQVTQWNYGGENHLFNVSASYAWTPCVNLLGGVEWNRGVNAFDTPGLTQGPTLPNTPWTGVDLLPSYSAVRVNTVRATAGADWQPYNNLTLYTRYVYFSYDDESQGYYTGESHMALAGGSILW